MTLFDSEVVQKPKSVFRYVALAAVVLSVVFLGYLKYADYQKTIKKAEAASAAERDWIVKTIDSIAQKGVALNDADAKAFSVAEANSKPARKGGKAVPQEKWSEEGMAEFRIAQDNRTLVFNALSVLCEQYKTRRGVYKGAWPKNAAPPDMLPSCKQ